MLGKSKDAKNFGDVKEEKTLLRVAVHSLAQQMKPGEDLSTFTVSDHITHLPHEKPVAS